MQLTNKTPNFTGGKNSLIPYLTIPTDRTDLSKFHHLVLSLTTLLANGLINE